MLTSLRHRRFRNLRTGAWSPAGGRQLLLGENGAGKTSLIEAIYVVATTRSFRTRQLADCALVEGDDTAAAAAGGFQVDATVETDYRVDLSMQWGEGRTQRLLNQSRVSIIDYLEPFPVVVSSAADRDLLAGDPEEGRRWMDRGVVAERVGRLQVLAEVRRVVRQKKELLRSGQAGLGEWNALLAERAAALRRLRRDFVARMEAALVEAAAESGWRFPAIGLRYEPSPSSERDDPETVLRLLERRREEERRRRRMMVGPQRDRLHILWKGVEAGRVASAGERKALSMLLALALGRQVRRARGDALVLLDDVDAELDTEALDALWPLFRDLPQVIATSNRGALWHHREAESVWTLREGMAEPR